MEPKYKLDQWLDQALTDYGHAEPRTGLETRVLANLAAEQTRISKRAIWVWTFGSTAFALIVVAVVWVWMSTQRARTPSNNFANNHTVAQPKQSVVSAQIDTQPKPAKRQRALPRQFTKVLELERPPRLDQFPSVRELSAQEQLLVRYAREFPQQALEIAQAQATAEQQRRRAESTAE